ncbi:MAG: deoxyribonuclease IV [Sulfobacillus sp.]
MKIGHGLPFLPGWLSLRLNDLAPGADAVQVCLGGLHDQVRARELDPLDLSLCRSFLAGKYVVVHGKYLWNLCRPPDGFWSGQLHSLAHELGIAAGIGADVIIHQGKNVLGLPREQALRQFRDNLEKVIQMTAGLPNSVLLENSAGQGTELGHSVDDLASIWQGLSPGARKRVGFCLDTCHAFVAGSLDLRQETSVDRFLDEFRGKIGIDRLSLIHLNDSKVPFGGRNDSHQDLLCGEIGRKSSQGLRHLVRECARAGVPAILETGYGVPLREQVELARSWAEKDDLNIEEAYRKKHGIAAPAKQRIRLKKSLIANQPSVDAYE